MGRNTRQRRAAKVKARARATGRSPGGRAGDGARRGPGDHSVVPSSPPPRVPDAELVRELVAQAAAFVTIGRRSRAEQNALRLADLPRRLVHRELAAQLRMLVSHTWSGGWQPVELVRHVRRNATAAAVDLVRAAIAADHAGQDPGSIDRRWTAQLDALDLPAVPSPTGAWLSEWADASAFDAGTQLMAAVDLVAVLMTMPDLEQLIPPPGAPGGPTATSAAAMPPEDVDRAMLAKIRALLAKAESTSFDAEAEAFTAKAHELMTRHSIDAALLAGRLPGTADSPITIRVAIDDPYADAKSLLLQVVADASRCRAVFLPDVSMSAVVGFPTELAGVELLFTSLLVQAQTALAAVAAGAPPGAHARSRSFRSSFLLAYARRIGERLHQINAHVEREAGARALPVLRDRHDAVDRAIEERFGKLHSSPVRHGHDVAGWAGGRLAAERARLSFETLAAGNAPAA